MNLHQTNTIQATDRRYRMVYPICMGFSLIELVLVMTIIGILSAIAVPRYAEALARYHADAAAQRVIADLDYAREYARSTSSGIEVVFDIDINDVTLKNVPSLENADEEWKTDLSGKPYLADLISTDFSEGSVVFDGYGYPDASGTIKLSVGNEARSIYLDAGTGKAVMQ